MKSAIVNIITATALTLYTPLAGMSTGQESIGASLERSGGNRTELEAALSKTKGSDTPYLITHASQYDQVSMTKRQIIENITYARKVHVALLYLGEKVDEDLWRDWVLPHRVLEEDLCLWRKEFYELAQPVIAGKETTAEVAESIRKWLWDKNEEGEMQVKFAVSENRLRSPIQLLRGGEAACGELAVLYISFLRSVGIPARHCYGGWWQGKDGWHFYVEYWDHQLKRWVATDDLDDPPAERVRKGHWNTFATYAVPGFTGSANAYYTGDFSQMINTTANVGEVAPFRFQVPGRNEGVAAIAVWNTLSWRQVAQPMAEDDGAGFGISLGQPKKNDLPVLLTVVRDGELLWGLTCPGEKGKEVELKAMEPGVCIKWQVGGLNREEVEEPRMDANGR